MKKLSSVIFLLVMGLIVLGVGLYLTFFQGKGYVETTAIIERVDESIRGYDDDGLPEYDREVYVTYTVDGKEYHEKTDFFKDGYEQGKEITIFYNPYDPSQIHGDSRGFGIYLVILGPVLILISAFVFIRGRRF